MEDSLRGERETGVKRAPHHTRCLNMISLKPTPCALSDLY